MNTELLSKYCKLLSSAASTFAVGNDEAIDEVTDDFDSISQLSNEKESFSNHLQLLEKAIFENDKQGCMEAIMLARVSICNAENAYSNFAESVEKLVVEMREN